MPRNNKALVEALISASDILVFVISTDSKITEWNPAAEKSLGYLKNEVTGKDFFKLFVKGENSHEIAEEFNRILEGKESRGYEYGLTAKSGEKKTFLWNAQRIFDEEGKISGIVATGRDISERIEREASLATSELTLRTLFESALDAIITIDERGIMESANPATSRLFGYIREEMIGKNVKMLMPQPDKGKHDGYIRNYLHTGEKKIIGIGREVMGRKKDGTEFPFRLSVTEMKIKGRRTFMGMVHDLTQQKEAENKIREYTGKLEKEVRSRTREIRETNLDLQKEIRERKAIEQALKDGQELYKAIARNFPDGTISVLDRQLRYVFIEGKELFAMRVTSRSLIGTNIADRLPPHLSRRITSVLENVFKNQKETIEIEVSGNTYVLNAVPLPGENGNVKQILVVEENITKLKKAEKDMKEALKKEIELNHLKSSFVSMASHEFRTPLTTILSSASLLEHYTGSHEQEKRDKHIKRIKNSVGTLTGILNDFLSLSKLEEGMIEFKQQKFDIVEFCEELTEEMQSISKNGQTILYNHSGAKTKVILDPQILKNILHNLLSNAIKYSPENKEIIFTSKYNAKNLVIEVKDNGIGIPEEDQHLLFDRFFRAKNVTNIQGTGLGLNIVKKYVELMEGSIKFVSKEGIGSKFTVSLPHK